MDPSVAGSEPFGSIPGCASLWETLYLNCRPAASPVLICVPALSQCVPDELETEL